MDIFDVHHLMKFGDSVRLEFPSDASKRVFGAISQRSMQRKYP